ncbi:unnamed protein product [Phytophthora lilii]|uniref:Unnamed protein product n=1 Tax=Phytophthora lilii TaxID=2077276 RepID=A0A9W6TY18_9STRA|nr:unnamed protein product [Phytophthora lilii]
MISHDRAQTIPLARGPSSGGARGIASDTSAMARHSNGVTTATAILSAKDAELDSVSVEEMVEHLQSLQRQKPAASVPFWIPSARAGTLSPAQPNRADQTQFASNFGRPTMWWSLLLLLSSLQLVQVAAQTCAAEKSTLSLSCGGVCDSYQPCLTYNVSDSTSCNSCVPDAAGECSYVCYNIYRQEPIDLSFFVFFITYGTYQSEEELAARAEDPTYDATIQNLPDNTSSYAWASNNIVTRIDALDLPSATKSVILAGGTNYDYTVKSKVVDLELADDLLTSQTQIPAVIFTIKSLTSLYLAGNPLKTPTFSADQVSFLEGLSVFDLTAADFQETINCDTSAQRTVQGLTVCVSDLIVSSASQSSGSQGDGSGSASNSNTVVIAAVAVGGAILLTVIGAIVYCRKARNADKPDPTVMTDPTVRTTRDNYENLSIWRDPVLLSVQVSIEDIQDVRLIGSGAFGVVWLVRYRSTQFLASKRLREDMATRDRVQDFVDEIKMVSRFDHPNIVTFVGAAWSIESDLQALFEYMENGDLRSYLAASYLPRYWTSTKFQLAIGAIDALVYVHSFDPPLVHRDLKSRNVLISADMNAKLTDFGTTRYRSKDGTMTVGVGTGRWVAPEIISGSTEYDQSADIFSFGVLLTEIDTHNLPYCDAVGPSGNKLEEVAVLQMVASGQLRPTISPSCPPTVRNLANLCMSQHPRDRPVAAEIAYVLRTVQKEMERA